LAAFQALVSYLTLVMPALIFAGLTLCPIYPDSTTDKENDPLDTIFAFRHLSLTSKVEPSQGKMRPDPTGWTLRPDPTSLGWTACGLTQRVGSPRLRLLRSSNPLGQTAADRPQPQSNEKSPKLWRTVPGLIRVRLLLCGRPTRWVRPQVVQPVGSDRSRQAIGSRRL
jgi:hypothetical protein